MSTTQLRIIGMGLCFLLIFFFGFWLSRSGKPYNSFVFSIHKLIALAAIVFLAMTVAKVHQMAPLSLTQIAVLVVTALFFVAAMVTGALLSIEKPMPLLVLRLHQVTPYLALLSTAAALYLILVKSSEMLKT